MLKKTKSIPVNPMADNFGEGITIEKIAVKDFRTFDQAPLNFEEATQSHRHDGHSFFLLENGTIFIEIDFQKYEIKPASIIYIHPNQVHRVSASGSVTISSWSITNGNLNPEYLKLLEEITPTKPLALTAETFALLAEAVALGLKFSERKNAKLYHSYLKDSCNALVAFVVSQYLEQAKSTDKLSRFDIVTKAFKGLLEHHYATAKRPAAYAQKLNISTPYLNECVKNTTGYSVSHHIQQRVILEAKRLLYHSDKTVKEIATELGYEDSPYFSRLFTKVAGMTPLTFRHKNHD